ncbi:MAG: c-type cytochrome [Burkholderiaceae bacterium]|nr:c-type cytochrome [Burkholderiaceae bacterium]
MMGIAATASVQASEQTAGLQLARANNCLACHQVDQKRVGPAFTVIAERFAGNEGAAAHLAQSIRKGSRGQWGPVPMPAQPQVNDANAQLIAAWILSLSSKN